MKITITIDSNPIGGTKTTVSIDDGSEPVAPAVLPQSGGASPNKQ